MKEDVNNIFKNYVHVREAASFPNRVLPSLGKRPSQVTTPVTTPTPTTYSGKGGRTTPETSSELAGAANTGGPQLRITPPSLRPGEPEEPASIAASPSGPQLRITPPSLRPGEPEEPVTSIAAEPATTPVAMATGDTQARPVQTFKQYWPGGSRNLRIKGNQFKPGWVSR